MLLLWGWAIRFLVGIPWDHWIAYRRLAIRQVSEADAERPLLGLLLELLSRDAHAARLRRARPGGARPPPRHLGRTFFGVVGDAPPEFGEAKLAAERGFAA